MESIKEVVEGVFKLFQGTGERCIHHNGEFLYRFMDCFYIRKEHLYELSPDEVSNLCRARSLFPELITDVNDVVQSIFKKLVLRVSPTSLLEIGSGSRPLLSSPPPGFVYVMSDADQSVIVGSVNGAEFCEFSSTNSTLPYGDNYFDMVVAVFVLQFKFYEEQISELYRCIAPNGVFVANVYRRPPAAGNELCMQFESKGFNVLRIPDPQSLCSDHEYWIISKCKSRMHSVSSLLNALLTPEV